MAYMKKMRKTKMRSKKNARKTKRIRGGAAMSDSELQNKVRILINQIDTLGKGPLKEYFMDTLKVIYDKLDDPNVRVTNMHELINQVENIEKYLTTSPQSR